jgi:hypothetical protein
MGTTSRRLRTAIGGIALLGGLTALTGTAAAEDPPLVHDDFGELTVEPGSVAPGASVAVSSSGCFEDAVVVRIDTPTPLFADGEPEADGDWSVTVAVPATTPAGTYDVDAVCDGYYDGFDYTTAKVTVTAPAPGTVAVHSSATAVEPGKPVTITADGFAPGEKVSATLHSDPVALGTFVADSAGKVTATVTIPTGTAAGRHEIVLVGQTSGRQGSVAITVTGIPITGSSALRNALIALAVLALGCTASGLSLLVPRRRLI